jgi:hypothetical protein
MNSLITSSALNLTIPCASSLWISIRNLAEGEPSPLELLEYARIGNVTMETLVNDKLRLAR